MEALGNCPVCPPLNRAVSGVMCVCVGTPGSALRRLGAVVQFSSPQSLLLGERRTDVLLWNMPHLPYRRTRRSVYSIHSHSLTHSLTRLSPLSLQRVQNKAARIVLKAPRRSHASPLLRTLHWLPVQQRIDYKVALLTFKVRSTSTPSYLRLLIKDREHGRNLRSTTTALCQPFTTTTFVRNALFDALHQLSGTHYRKLFSVVTLFQFLSLG